MTHDLIVNYGLYPKMSIFRPRLLGQADLCKFHDREYISFLKNISPDNMKDKVDALKKFAVGEDCPIFDGIYEFSQLCSSGSVGGAVRLNSGLSDVVINWSGGLHHAKKQEASGFCYTNDCVLAILELLKRHQRVLYIDIDIHHGDGVEEAFYTTNRVMTCSFHKFGDFFPGTGDIIDVGEGEGKGYAVNFPLNDGLDDASFGKIFRAAISNIMTYFDPGAVVLQCGADSLAGDRLGVFNLTLRGHADAVNYVQQFGRPLLVLGGGGYTVRNVARCWTNETAVILGEELSDTLPFNNFFEYYAAGDYKLHIHTIPGFKNENSEAYLAKLQERIVSGLKALEHTPGSQIQTGQPGTSSTPMSADAQSAISEIIDGEVDGARGDVRMTQTELDEKID